VRYWEGKGEKPQYEKTLVLSVCAVRGVYGTFYVESGRGKKPFRLGKQGSIGAGCISSGDRWNAVSSSFTFRRRNGLKEDQEGDRRRRVRTWKLADVPQLKPFHRLGRGKRKGRNG